MKAHIICGLGYGDEGKGLTTDFLCSQSTLTIVVRYTGGHQAGHTVVHNKLKHVFSNFGSGTLRNIPTYFTEHCVMYPVTIYNEKIELEKIGIKPEVYYHPLTKLTTPYDVIYNRIIEKKIQHGSCGLGIGSTMDRNNNSGYKLYAVDLDNERLLRIKLNQISNYYYSKLTEESDRKLFVDLSYQEYNFFMNTIKHLTFKIAPYEFLNKFDNVVFEGSQGILLDMNHGIFPNVTYGNTTSKNAIEVCDKIGIKDVTIWYITRCYQTRHGNGWMSNTSKIDLINNEDEINVFNEWQGDFRVSEIDYDLIKYAIHVDNIYSKNHPKILMVTCLDQRPDFNFDYKQFNDIQFKSIFNSYSPESSDVRILPQTIKK